MTFLERKLKINKNENSFLAENRKVENDQIAHFGAENENKFPSASSLMA